MNVEIVEEESFLLIDGLVSMDMKPALVAMDPSTGSLPTAKVYIPLVKYRRFMICKIELECFSVGLSAVEMFVREMLSKKNESGRSEMI